jgi:hypothetical protein
MMFQPGIGKDGSESQQSTTAETLGTPHGAASVNMVRIPHYLR